MDASEVNFRRAAIELSMRLGKLYHQGNGPQADRLLEEELRRQFSRGRDALHAEMIAPMEISLCGFTLNRRERTISYNGSPIDLSDRQFDLAWLLFMAPDKLLHKSSLSELLWGGNHAIHSHTVEQHCYILRNKLILDGTRGLTLITKRSVGYCLTVASVVASGRRTQPVHRVPRGTPRPKSYRAGQPADTAQ